jgi:hypothetical protein
MAPLISVPSPGAIVLLTESAECQRAEGEAQIAQRNVEVAQKYKQVENDAQEPGCDDVSENPWLDSHPDAGGDLDYPHNGHKETRGNQVSDEGRELFLPVNKPGRLGHQSLPPLSSTCQLFVFLMLYS